MSIISSHAFTPTLLTVPTHTASSHTQSVALVAIESALA
tara:strand:- start:4269 stop:4385 length:117 start_codon:yes stop_codon:yes gene_type:complete